MPSLKDRRSGLLLHISSLPSDYICGDLGKAAYRFADFLKAGGQSWWQMLPVNPIGLGNSPYSTLCSFAGEPLYIDLEALIHDGFLAKPELSKPQVLPPNRVNYQNARRFREPLLRKAFERFYAKVQCLESPKYNQFQKEQRYWLDDFALFCVFAKKFRTHSWIKWPSNIRKHKSAALNDARKSFKEDLEFIKFLQFMFFVQWFKLKSYLNRLGIGLIGDIPLFVGHQSSDVWAKQKYFRLKNDGAKKFVTGVPPDYYCPKGQLWGHPLYNWNVMQKDGFKWWIQRFRHMMTLFDVVRLDHFIGFHRCWEIRAESKTAKNGRFRKTPGRALFQKLKALLGDLPIIAEDLGTVVPEVYTLRDEFQLPGMRVLQFGFGNDRTADYHLPFSYTPNSVVYTGTHDNNTVVGWYDEAKKDLKKKEKTYNLERIHAYLGVKRTEIHWEMIREAMKSVANLCIFPVQDILGLDANDRVNIPGTAKGNWRWRMEDNRLGNRLARRLKKETQTFNRLP
jgi:4-alpha-glucanotransferase